MSDDTRLRIVRASGPIFAAQGYENATVRQICDAAQVNHAAINYYFGGKQGLYLEAVRLAHQTRMAEYPSPIWAEHTPPREKLYLSIRVMLCRLMEPSEENWPVRLLMREMIQPTAACHSLVEDFLRLKLQRLLDVLAEIMPEPLPNYRLWQLAFSIIGQCIHYRVARQFVAMLVPADERAAHFGVEQLARHITEFSVAALDTLSHGGVSGPEWVVESSLTKGIS